jgi:hypothetical protein
MDTSHFLIDLFFVCFGLILVIVGLLLMSSAWHLSRESVGYRAGTALSGGMLAGAGAGLILAFLGVFG